MAVVCCVAGNGSFSHNLTRIILNHNEPKTIANAVPSYLLLLETLIENEPDNEALLS